MPVRPRKEIQKRGAGGLTERDYTYFSFGDFFEAENYADGKSEGELKAFWNKNKRAIMKRFMNENCLRGHKGRRPWPYWKWDMTEPRLPVDMRLADNELYDNTKVGSDGFEADYAYLKRLGLLETWEME